MSTYETWADVSAYQGIISIEALNAMKASGITGVVIQAWGGRPNNEWGVNPNFSDTALKCLQSGLDIAAYIVLEWTAAAWPGGYQVDRAVANIGELLPRCLFVALDVEWYPNAASSDTASRASRTQEAIARLSQVLPATLLDIAYSNVGSMGTLYPTGAPAALLTMPIWYAHPDGALNTTDSWAARPWPDGKVLGKQYGNNTFAGTDADLDIFFANWMADARAAMQKRIAPPPPSQSPTPPPPPLDVAAVVNKSDLVALANAFTAIAAVLRNAAER